MGLIGSNKTATTQRLISGVYTEYLPRVSMRYEQQASPRNPESFITKASHCTFSMVVEVLDIQVRDRVLVDGKTFVVAGVQKANDLAGKHLEISMRETSSPLHTTVMRRTLSNTQGNYDPILKEWNKGEKTYIDTELSVLLDQSSVAKAAYKILNEAGKFNNIEWLLTLDLPDVIVTDDRILFEGKQYRVNWVEDQIYEKLVGLQSDMDNSPTNL